MSPTRRDSSDSDDSSTELTDNLATFFPADVKFLSFFVAGWPRRMSVFDTQKLVIVFFTLSSCTTLDMLPMCFKAAGSKDTIIEWIYSLQIISNESDKNG